MSVKEKLVELLLQEDGLCKLDECKDCNANGSCYYYRAADRIIAHGVTVQEWISVKDRLPEENERVLVWIGNNRYNDVRKDTDRVHNGKWVRWGGCVTHWAPWNMPQPPKGE